MEFVFDCRWTDSLSASDKYVEDFLYVLATTWNVADTAELKRNFENRYFHNIYGPSLLTVIYCEEKPAGSGAMWRNDIGGRVAFQRIDTCTLEAYRGHGLFRKAIEKELSLIGEDTLSYGFANPSSLDGYLKFGWKVLKADRVKIMFSPKNYLKRNPSVIDASYARWYLVTFREKIFRIRRGGMDFLVMPTSRPRIYQIIGVAEKEAVKFFDPAPSLSVLVYSSIPTDTDPSNQGNIVVTRFRGDVIPLWKCDAL